MQITYYNLVCIQVNYCPVFWIQFNYYPVFWIQFNYCPIVWTQFTYYNANTELGTGKILVMAITFSCAAINFPAVYNLQLHQKPVPLIPCLCGVRS